MVLACDDDDDDDDDNDDDHDDNDDDDMDILEGNCRAKLQKMIETMVLL